MSTSSNSNASISCRSSTGHRSGVCSSNSSNTHRTSETRSNCSCCQTASTRHVQALDHHPIQVYPPMNVPINEICVEADWLAEQALSEWASPQLNFRSVLNAHTARRKGHGMEERSPNARPNSKRDQAQRNADVGNRGGDRGNVGQVSP